MRTGERIDRLRERLGEPVDGASLAVVRIALGLLVAAEAANYLASDWIAVSFLDPSFNFTFHGLDWVQPWAGAGMYVHFAVLGALGLLLAAGVAHRLVAGLTAIGFAHVFLLEKAEYLNHFYAAILFIVLVAIAPADRTWSLSALRRPERPRTVPLWSVWALRAQIGIVYFYAGVAKLGSDWIAGEPMGMWLADRADLAVIGGLLGASWAGLAFSWAGLAFDLAIVPLLLWRRTRAIAYCLALGFHLLNWWIFDIGIFPPMMIAATTIFFDPDWPRQAIARARRFAGKPAPATASRAGGDPARRRGTAPAGALLVAFLGAWFAFQALAPLRHHLYPGLVHWTEEGHRFAWHMKLRDKQGWATFTAVDRRTGERRTLDTLEIISPRQHAKASVRPDMLLQLAHELARREREAGRDVEIRVEALVTLNDRPPRHLVDPERDLSREPRGPRASDWIEPVPPRPG